MNPKQNMEEFSVQELEQLLLEKRQQQTGQTIRRVASAEQTLGQDENGGTESNVARSPELWRGARGRDRYFRTVHIRPFGPDRAASLSGARALGLRHGVWRKRILPVLEIVLVLGFAVIMGRAYMDMRELNQSMSKQLSEPSPTPESTSEIIPWPTQTAEAPAATVVSVQGDDATLAPVSSPTALRLIVLPGSPSQPIAELPESRPTLSESAISVSPTAKLEGDAAGADLERAGKRLVIAQINVDAPIVGGDTWEDLKHGIGLHEGSVAPGLPGNLILSAHNDVYGEIFRELHKLVPGEMVTVHWEQETYTYRVRQVEIVEPTRVDLIEQTVEPRLTLITCYPYLLDTHRVIVIADLAQ